MINEDDVDMNRIIRMLVEDGKYTVGRDGKCRMFIRDIANIIADTYGVERSNSFTSFVRINFLRDKEVENSGQGWKLVIKGDDWI